MELKITRFIQGNQFDLNSYLTYLFKKGNENTIRKAKKNEKRIQDRAE